MRRDKEVRPGQEAGFSAEPTRIDMQSSPRSLDETARQTSTGRRIVGVLASGLGRRSSSHYSPTDSPNSPSLLAKRQFAFPILAVLAVAALGLWLLLPGGALRAQDAAVEYAENGKDPVATFTAVDPEGATPITWSLAEAAVDHEATAADVADYMHFDISKDGVLTFDIGGDDAPDSSVSPDFENPQGGTADTNTYRVVVVASDAEAGGVMGYEKVTVKVTNVDEDGKVSWTVDPDGFDDGGSHTVTMPKLTQFQVGASLMASVEDGDIGGDDKTVAVARTDVVADPIWRWYRSSSKTSTGTMIDDANSDTYTVTPADVGMYMRAVASYVITGNVAQETASLTSDYPVLATRIGANKLKFDPGAVSKSIPEAKKGADVGAPVTATGNHGAVNYTLAGVGADNSKFEIDQKTGQITTDVDLDYDAADEDNCRDADFCTVTVRATDASGDSTDVAPTIDATVTIKVTDVNEKPTFSIGDDSDPMARTAIEMPENNTVLSTSTDVDENDVTYRATDPEGRNLTYRLMGLDAAKFELSNIGVLSFMANPDYEMPGDRDRDNVYEVTVRASDSVLYADRMVAVTVTNEDDAPEITGKDSVSFPENSKDPVATFTAVDPEGATPIRWSVLPTDAFADIAGVVEADAADADDFTIDDETGVLKFNIAEAQGGPSPDFENEQDTGTDNTYKVVVAACDVTATDCTDGQTGYHKVTVKVTNVAEKGKVTWTVAPDGSNVQSVKQFQVGAALTASATDGDIEETDKAVGSDESPTWRWYRGSTLISDAETNAYTVTDQDIGSRIRVEATYRVGISTTQKKASLTSDYPVLVTRHGANKLKFDPDTLNRSVAESKKGANVGTPVTATGNHGAVNYTLAGVGADNSKFEIDQKTGQITTDVDLDYDAADEDNCRDADFCTVTVRATDASGSATTDRSDGINIFVDATVTIKVTDVNQKPTFTETAGTALSPKAIERVENMTALADADADVTYAAEDPEGLNVNLTLMGPDGDKFSLSSGGVLSFEAQPDYENPGDANRDNVYMVTVRASDGTLHEDWMVRVTVTGVNEAPEIIQGGLRISGQVSVSLAEEGSMTTVGSYTASGPEASSVRWTLEGADAMYFKVGTARGAMTELMFKSAPDYEMPRGRAMSDANTNVYMVTLKATEGTDMDTHEVTVTVINVDEMGMVADISGAARVDSELTAGMVTDPDGSVSGERWTWERSMNGTAWSAISGATLSTYTAMAGDVGYYLRVSVTYTDGQGSGKMVTSAMTAKVVAVGAVDPLITRYAGDDGVLQKSEMIDAINDHVFGDGDDRISKDDMIKVINLHVFG